MTDKHRERKRKTRRLATRLRPEQLVASSRVGNYYLEQGTAAALAKIQKENP